MPEFKMVDRPRIQRSPCCGENYFRIE